MYFSAYGLESTLNSYGRVCDWAYPTSWKVYGSNNKNANWDLLDSKEENSYLNERNVLHIFNLSRKYVYKYIKLEVHTTSTLYFGLSRFELFGETITDSFVKKLFLQSCQKGKQITFHPSFLINVFIKA